MAKTVQKKMVSRVAPNEPVKKKAAKKKTLPNKELKKEDPMNQGP